MRRRATLAGVLPIAAVVTVAIVLVLGPTSVKSPLLIPTAHAGPGGGQIEFFGVLFEGDCFVWCLDKSGSMAWVGLISVLKAEVIEAIDQLSPDQEFGLVAFSTNLIAWSPTPQPATQANKDSATTWVNALNAAGWTCMLEACLECLSISEQSAGSDRNILVAGDGIPVCSGVNTSQQVLDEVTAANTLGIPIHTIYLANDSTGIAFFQELAALNGGGFVNVNGGLPQFLRGDADADGNVSALIDGLFVLSYQFVAGSPEPPCLDAADADDSGAISGVIDGIFLLNYGFVAGSPPPPDPGPLQCDSDPTIDPLTCALAPICP